MESLPRISLERQKNGELRAARLAFHFDQSIVLMHERLRERETQTAAIFTARHQRKKDAIAYLRRNARPVVSYSIGKFNASLCRCLPIITLRAIRVRSSIFASPAEMRSFSAAALRTMFSSA